MTIEKNRDLHIDVIKGIGILLVIWAHCTFPFKKEIILFHMPLFFFLSGMFFKDKKNFINTRAKKLLLPFFYYSVLAFFLSCLFGNPKELLNNLSFYNPGAFNGPLWFLIALFNISLSYYCIYQISQNWKFILIICSVIGVLFFYLDYEMPLYLRQSFVCLPFFAFGHFLKIKGYKLNRIQIIIYIIIYLLASAYYEYNRCGIDIYSLHITSNFILFYLPAFAAILLLLNIPYFNKNTKTNKLLVSLGQNSLALMSLHTLFLYTLRDIIYNQFYFSNIILNRLFSGVSLFILITIVDYFCIIGFNETKKIFK